MVISSLSSQLALEARRGSEVLMISMTAIHGSPEKYLARMKRRGEFADHILLLMLASVLQHDIILLPVHPETSPNNYVLLPGGDFGTEARSINKPIFMAYFEETRFQSGHFQAMEPLPNEVVRNIFVGGENGQGW